MSVWLNACRWSSSPVYTIQPVVKPVVTCCQTGCTTRFGNQLYRVGLYKHSTGWQTAVSCIQPVVKPVIQPDWQPAVSCKRGITVQTDWMIVCCSDNVESDTNCWTDMSRVADVGRCHWLMEPFVVSAMRQLSSAHPVYKLLKPYFRWLAWTCLMFLSARKIRRHLRTTVHCWLPASRPLCLL